MRRATMTAAAVLIVAGCSNGGGGALEVTAGTTPAGLPAVTTAPVATREATPQAGTPKKTNQPGTVVTAQSDDTFIMPKVVGLNLQAAQDELQSKGSYLLDQEDATKQHRIQIIDRDWKVCTQIPRAGRKVPLSTIIRLAAVKLDERCP